jgi:hypothetical protein
MVQHEALGEQNGRQSGEGYLTTFLRSLLLGAFTAFKQ